MSPSPQAPLRVCEEDKLKKVRRRILIAISALQLFGFAGQTFAADFYSEGYTYCDAEFMATFWNESVSDAKARINTKLEHGGKEVVEELLRDGQRGSPQPRRQM